MPTARINGVLRCLRRAALSHDGGGLSDGRLLERFIATREEAAFEALLRRHGPMVLGVCRRVLHREQDAEDAFQAAFLVLVRKAGSLSAKESVGNWLYGVAFRTAQKARAESARRRAKETRMARPEAVFPHDDLWGELRPLLDRELSRLPEKYREPVVLCDLQGQTRKEAARRLGCPEGTVSGRLARARVMLAKRLARRGLALSGGAVAVTLVNNAASACVPAPLLGSTVQAAARVAAGWAAAGAVSAPIAALTEGVLKTMGMNKVKMAVTLALAIGLIGAGWGVYTTHAEPPAATEGNKAAPATPEPAKTDEKINLPTSPAPVQVLASIDKDGKLVIKTVVVGFRAQGGAVGAGIGGPVGGPVILPAPAPGNPPAPGGVPRGGPPAVQQVTELRTQTFDLDDVEILDVKAKSVDKKDAAKMLKEETPALASLFGQKVDPLHLRLVKEGTLTFVLPMPKGVPGIPGGVAPPGIPQPFPLPPGGGPGAGFGGGFGVAVPGGAPPGAVTAPAPPAKP
jgi:RNA polymerase sigma factor (sigma-70 family)